MRLVPKRRLVVEDVVLQPAVGGDTPARDQVVDPPALNGGVVQRVGVGLIVPRDLCAVAGAAAVAGIGHPLRVVAGLRAVLGNRVAGQLGAVGAQARDPADGRNRHGRLGPGPLGVGDEVVAALACGRTGFGNALEVPVLTAIVRVDLPVVPRGVVAAVSIQRRVEIRQLRRCRVSHAIDVGVDGPARLRDVDPDGHGAALRKGPNGRKRCREGEAGQDASHEDVHRLQTPAGDWERQRLSVPAFRGRKPIRSALL